MLKTYGRINWLTPSVIVFLASLLLTSLALLFNGLTHGAFDFYFPLYLFYLLNAVLLLVALYFIPIGTFLSNR